MNVSKDSIVKVIRMVVIFGVEMRGIRWLYWLVQYDNSHRDSVK